MLATQDVITTVDTIRSASARTEATFLQVGRKLEASIGILARLTATFETLLAELKSESLDRAIVALSRAADQVVAFGRAHSGERAVFDRLQHLAHGIAGRVLQMNKAVGDVDSLVINSKIAAAHIRATDVDLSTFAGEIARTLKMTRRSLESFASELRSVRERVAAAQAEQAAFERRQDEAARTIPVRLTETVESIAQQNERAADASAAVGRRSDLVRERIGAAIMALQIGDITRQRLEHVDHALGILAEGPKGPAGDPRHDAGDGEELSDEERRALACATYRLQSAQLADAAAAFERDVQEIAAALQSVAAEARGLWSLGSDAYGASHRGRSSFIAALESQVGEALGLFRDFEAARTEAAQVVTSVSGAMESLSGHLKQVQSLEADIRIVGLNTTFKCARVGRDGLALSVIAQELRAYGHKFAVEAGALMDEVETVTKVTESLTRDEHQDAVAPVAEVMQAMTSSLATLRQVGQAIGDTLTSLESDSGQVATLLDETVANLAAHDEIGRALRETADRLASMSPGAGQPVGDLTPGTERLLERMARAYTMANERIVHERVFGRSSNAALAAATAAPAELDDILF